MSAVVEVLRGSYSDDTKIVRFYALLANYRPAWHRDAACRGKGPDAWYPEAYDRPTAEVAETCAACPVRSECGDAGLTERFGLWGGMTVAERRQLRRQGRHEAVPA